LAVGKTEQTAAQAGIETMLPLACGGRKLT
jgi:hypothetical protein